MGSALYLFTFILAFCSIVYELLLGQSLSAFLGNTVLRYCVTIGLYMLAMGIGSLLAEGRFVRHPVVTLLKVEVLLTITGGFSVIFLHAVYWFAGSDLLFSMMAHSLIILIGILTGFEIPLLIEVKKLDSERAENPVIGVDYVGAFCGAVVFAFIFYPKAGILPTAFLVALLNALVGVGLLTQVRKVHRDKRTEYAILLGAQSALLVTTLLCLLNSGRINEFLMQRYLAS